MPKGVHGSSNNTTDANSIIEQALQAAERSHEKVKTRLERARLEVGLAEAELRHIQLTYDELKAAARKIANASAAA